MTVKELIAILQGCDEDARVYVMSQERYPWECTFAGVAVRRDFDEEHEAEEPGANDVFLLEGSQIRYGSDEAWGAARR